jgi:hypothetical protein
MKKIEIEELTEDAKQELDLILTELARTQGQIHLRLHLANMDLREDLERLRLQITTFEHSATTSGEALGSDMREAFRHLVLALDRVKSTISEHPVQPH